MIHKLFIHKIYSDDEIKKLEGNWIDNSYIKYPILNSDTDVYYNDNGIYKLLLKFRKNVISDNIIDIGWQSYKDLAKPGRGRGAAAGPINASGKYWSQRTLVNTNKWRTNYMIKGKMSKMKVNNQVASYPIGYYEASNQINKVPCRLTHFSKTNYDKYVSGIPFIEKIDELYKELVPSCYENDNLIEPH